MKAITFTIDQLVELLDIEMEGDGSATIRGLNSLSEASVGDLSFVFNPRYVTDVAKTRATAVLVPLDWDDYCPCTVLRCSHPDLAFSRAGALFAPPAPRRIAGVHATAVLGPDVQLGEGISIGPHCVIEDGVTIGDNTLVEAGCFIGMATVVGEGCHFYPHVSIREYVRIGDRVLLQNGTVIGSDGFGYTVDADGVRSKIPQIGTVEIGNDVEIGANATVDRARFGCTRIGNGVKIDNLVQIGHNVVVEDHAVIIAQVGIAGSSRIGKGAILAGQVGITGHIRVGAGAIIGAQSGVSKDVPEGAYMFGYPAAPYEKSARLQAHLHKLPDLRKQVKDLQERINKL